MDVLYGGVNTSIKGEGGSDCAAYLSFKQRVIETIVYSCIAIWLIFNSWYRAKLPFSSRYPPSLSSRQRTLLTIHGIIFGMELGFKCSTRSLIWVANPCHVLTIIQCFLLAMPPSPLLTSLYRLHIHMLNGPLIAIIFPVVEARSLHFERAIYYLQHIMILIIPAIVMKVDSPFSVEPQWDYSWVTLSLGVQICYHFLVLQPIGLLSHINMNAMICPGSSDPFAGPYYRVIAMLHQPFLIMVIGKTYSYLTTKFKRNRFLRACTDPKSVSTIKIPEGLLNASTVQREQVLKTFDCRLVTELTTSPFISSQFSKFYYSAIPVSITQVLETRVAESPAEAWICNQSILFVPKPSDTEETKSQ